ncbi:hypothetical protein [Bdellovibrio sp. HCB209]|uniref:hypothetical protein n=1 Tax=Bdellovibrio sp. HCB209 TaxID=3394354 RepID=UPI0039B3C53A
MKMLILISMLGLGSFAHADAPADVACMGFYNEDVKHVFDDNAVAFTESVYSGQSSGDENFTLFVVDDKPVVIFNKTNQQVPLKKILADNGRLTIYAYTKIKPNIEIVCESKGGGF